MTTALVDNRDDLSVELMTLYNSSGCPEEALRLLLARHFQPWEGGEGTVLAQYVRANMLPAQRALTQDDAHAAIDFPMRPPTRPTALVKPGICS